MGSSFEHTLEEDESVVLTVNATPTAYPDAFLWATDDRSSAFTLEEDGQVESAEAVLLVPGDLMIRERGGTGWTGEDTILSPEVNLWAGTQHVPSATDSTDGRAVYYLKLENVKNAPVSYRVKTHKAAGCPAVIQRCHVVNPGGDWLEVQDISSAITSPTGYTTDHLSPGASLYLRLYILPVGSESGSRSIGISAAVDDVDGLDGLHNLPDLIPIAACLEDLPPEGETFDLYGPPDAGTLTPGNFGMLDFDGGANNVPELEDWMINRYTLSVPDNEDHVWVYGSPGFKSAVGDEMQSLVGKRINVPICTRMTSEGANTEFKMEGYARVVLQSFSSSDATQATFEWLSFNTLPMLKEGVICHTSPRSVLGLGPWEETNSAE